MFSYASNTPQNIQHINLHKIIFYFSIFQKNQDFSMFRLDIAFKHSMMFSYTSNTTQNIQHIDLHQNFILLVSSRKLWFYHPGCGIGQFWSSY